MTVLEYRDYKEYLRDLCTSTDMTYVKLARAAKFPRQYIGQILRGKSHLNDDQGAAIARLLKFNELEMDYFIFLIQENKATSLETKKYFRNKLEKIHIELLRKATSNGKEENVYDTANSEEMSEYVMNVELQICHTLLSLPDFQVDMRKLAHHLGRSENEVEDLVLKLVELGFVEKRGLQFVPTKRFVHIPKSSRLAEQHAKSWRLNALSNPRASAEASLRFTSTIVASKTAKAELIRKMRGLLSEFHSNLEAAPNEHAFQINADVFSI